MIPVLHERVDAPTQSAPPKKGPILERLWDPTPHPDEDEHDPHELHTQSTGHCIPVSHDLELLPEQSEPPFAGGGFVHVRVCTPVPQPELEVHVP